MSLSLVEFLEQGPATSRQIQAAAGISQAGVSRWLRKMGREVVAIRNGRTPRYVMTRNAFGGNDKLPLSSIDAHGNTALMAHIRPLVTGGFCVEPSPGMPGVLLGAGGDGVFDDLPFFLKDMCPQGFLGNLIALEMNAQFPEFPADPRRWITDHIGRYLISNGDDLPGNLKFGEQALLRVRRKPEPVDDLDYPSIAKRVLSGDFSCSYAGGQQPKFAVFSKRSMSHVIVKFSPSGENEISRRWRDIMVTEYHALEALRRVNIQAAEARLFEVEGRLFLECKRFDRSGEYGRMSMLSLASIDAEFARLGSDWPHIVKTLLGKGLIAEEDAFDAERLWCFGRLINNTDMHLGNLSFAMDGNVFRLLPAYDMSSMGFAPKSGGEVRPYSFEPKHPKRKLISDNEYAAVFNAAMDFWDSVARDDRISDEFRRFLSIGSSAKLME
jgi:hypothetical protein